jgi:hypothetical protein
MAIKQKRNYKKTAFIALGLIALVAAVLAVLEISNTTHLFHKSASVSSPSAAIKKLPAHPLANNGEKQPDASTGTNKQTATDNHGQAPSSSTDQSKWLSSQSGAIVVKSPGSNSTFKPGGQLYGSSSLAEVQYRLIDNQVGVISQGPVSVVSGNFSATVNFTASSGSGRLDVFSTDANGKEYNEVQVPVNF